MPVVSVYGVGHETCSGHPKRGSMIEYPVPHNDVTAAPCCNSIPKCLPDAREIPPPLGWAARHYDGESISPITRNLN